jgi:nitrogen fixation protein NifB
VYSSQQAVDQVQNSLAATPGMAVAEIAGPGDPLATPELTLETLRLLRQHVPNLILSVATNGMGLTPEFVKALAKVGVSHVTITVNVVDPDLGQHIYRWCRDGRQLLQGHLAASRLLERQRLAVQALKASGLMVTVHTVVMPGINNHHVVAISREMKALGADRQTCLPLYPSPQTPFAVIPMPTPTEMAELRHRASRFLPQGSDCG